MTVMYDQYMNLMDRPVHLKEEEKEEEEEGKENDIVKFVCKCAQHDQEQSRVQNVKQQK